MKIALLNIYNGVIDRGAETFVKELATRLSIKNNVTVYQSGQASGEEKYCVKVIPIKFDWTKKPGSESILQYIYLDYWARQIIKFSFKAVKYIWEGKYDIVIPVNGGWMPIILRVVTWLSGSKMIITGQSGMGRDDIVNLFSFPDSFVSLSTKALNWAKRINPFVKSILIPNGVDLKRFSPKGETIKLGLERPIVLCSAALTPTKRIDAVIKSFSKIEKGSLLILGDGVEKEKLEKMGSAMLGNRFKLMKVKYEDISKYYRSVDLFTLPSQSWFAFEIVLVEALASGLGVVANKDEIRKEIVGDAGLLTDPTNEEEYASTIKKALLIKWGNKPTEQAKKYDWDIITQKYLILFNSLLK